MFFTFSGFTIGIPLPGREVAQAAEPGTNVGEFFEELPVPFYGNLHTFLEADLRSADLSGAKLRNAILWSADLRDTKLGRADLCGANLRGTNLSGAKLEADKAVLLGAKYNSETKWPEGFDLRGCTPKDRGAVLESINIFEPHEQDWKKRVEETEKLVRESYITYGTESLAEGWGSTKNRGSIPLNVRQQVFRNAENRCQQCGKSASDGVKLEVDHIMPVSRGGSDDISNLELLCFECNRGKSDRVD